MLTRKTFASIAEAVAYYLQKGYSTVVESELKRVMRRGRNEVEIKKEDFLLVKCEEYTA
jgi:hypothetical protein